MGKHKTKKSKANPAGDSDVSIPHQSIAVKAADPAAASATPAFLNPAHCTPDAVADYKATFSAGLPFPHLRVKEFFKDPAFLDEVKGELLAQKFAEKGNDLYQFRQSDDLKMIQTRAVASLRRQLYSPQFRNWLTSVTGIVTNDTIDMSCSIYSDTSYLLCHDDDLSERRIAYIIYFVSEEWAAEDGGSLDLYGHDGDSRPTDVVKRLIPAWNSFAMFAVSSISHHQVAEVLTSDKGPRMSVVGWFHGEPLERHPFPLYPAPELRPVLTLESLPPFVARACPGDDVAGTLMALVNWVNPVYFMPGGVASMRSHFAKNSSIQLKGFLQAPKYSSVEKAMSCQPWRFVGPPNVRHYKQSPEYDGTLHGSIPDSVALLRALLCSESFADYLSDVTNMEFESLCCEVRCFTHGDYSMLCDPQYKAALRNKKSQRIAGGAGEPACDPTCNDSDGTAASAQWVDVTFCVVDGPDSEWDESAGGHISYLTYDEPLLTVCPDKNTLSVVFRTGNVMSFVKYLNHTAPGNRYDIALSFKVKPDGASSSCSSDGDEDDDSSDE